MWITPDGKIVKKGKLKTLEESILDRFVVASEITVRTKFMNFQKWSEVFVVTPLG